MRPLNRIIIHCAATRPGWMAQNTTADKVAEIRRWHVEDRGWNDIGYHFLIDRDGTVAEGRPVHVQGAHVAGHNEDSIGVCLLGGHGSNENDSFAEHFTAAQDDALRKLLRKLQDVHGRMTIHGHNEFAAKACPGFSVARWLARKPAQPTATERNTKPLKDRRFWEVLAPFGGSAGVLASGDGPVQYAVAAVLVLVAVAFLFLILRRD